MISIPFVKQDNLSLLILMLPLSLKFPPMLRAVSGLALFYFDLFVYTCPNITLPNYYGFLILHIY